jgi:hypothetical protein
MGCLPLHYSDCEEALIGGFGSGGGFRGEYVEPLQDFNMAEPAARSPTAGGGNGTGAHPFLHSVWHRARMKRTM